MFKMQENEKLQAGLIQLNSIESAHLIDLSDAQDARVIHFVEQLFENAYTNFISDIHIEPYENLCRIRARKDGLLSEVAQISPEFANRILIRLKILAQLNIAEKRLPQDGHLVWLAGQNSLDVRINSCPTLFGEKLVLRLQNNTNSTFNLKNIGLSPSQYELLLKKLTQPQGLILVTGPTGSGKTITLYSALNFLNLIEKNIITIEDPVEIKLPGINQININTKIGLSFSTALRACLRQDPDILMIGEIRDEETAKFSLQAAQTGHLVLATLHTNSAAETIQRLEALNVEKDILNQSLTLIIAQRLVRKLCPHCRLLNSNEHFISYLSKGCDECKNGYKGRTGIYELHDSKEKKLSVQPTLQGLSLSANDKIHDGITSIQEVERVLGEIIY